MLVNLMEFNINGDAIIPHEYEFNIEYKDNDLYHHSEKGCDIEARYDKQFTLTDDRPIEYLYCKTHNCYCSKTGWLFHHYLGNDSLQWD